MRKKKKTKLFYRFFKRTRWKRFFKYGKWRNQKNKFKANSSKIHLLIKRHNTTNEVSDDLLSITVDDLLTSNHVLTNKDVPETSQSYFEPINPPPTVPIVKISQKLLIRVEEVERYFHLHELVKKNAARALCSYLKYNITGINTFDDAGRTPAMLSILCTALHLAAKTNDQVSLILLKSNSKANFKLLNKLGEPPALSAFESLDSFTWWWNWP